MIFTPDSTPHVYKMVVEKEHIDEFGHVNNAVYLKLYERARWSQLKDHGITLDDILKIGKGPAVLDLKVRFRKEIMLGMTIFIYTQLHSQRGKLFNVDQWIETEDRLKRSEASFTMGIFDLQKRKLVELSPQWLRYLTTSPVA